MSPNAQLLYAACCGDTATVQALLKSGVAVDVRDGRGRTSLMLAAREFAQETVQVLLDAGANCTAVNNGNQPMIDFASTPAIARMLLAAMPEAARTGAASRLLFRYHMAVEFLQVALEFGAKLNTRDKRGSTSLHFHAANGNEECVRWLLAAGAAPDERNCHGRTPLFMSMWMGRAATARLLLQAGADSHTIDNDGKHLHDILCCGDSCSACTECRQVLAAFPG